MFDVMDSSPTVFNSKIFYTSMKFSGGEIHVRITDPTLVENPLVTEITITAQLTDSDKIMELVMLVDALRRIKPTIKLKLIAPYLPYARQDRVCADGEALSLRVMTDMINALNFESVEVWDVHSDASLATINRVKNLGPETFLNNVLNRTTGIVRVSDTNIENYVLVSPDAGAMKKVSKVAKKFNIPMLTASKIRNPQNGEITGTQIHIPAEYYGKTFLIVDDICDGGRTFTELAKAIIFEVTTFNKVEVADPTIELYVTHGIFSKGLDVVFESGISKIYSANPFPGVDTTHANFQLVTK